MKHMSVFLSLINHPRTDDVARANYLSNAARLDIASHLLQQLVL